MVAGVPSAIARLEVTEYLQERVLALLQDQSAMVPLAFQGGTALRLLYGLDRYSEDLDFALERREDLYRPMEYAHSIREGLVALAFDVEVSVDTHRVVHVLWVRVPGLPFDLGLSPHPAQQLAVKVGVDTTPPAGAGTTTTVVRRRVLLNIQHHDRATLLAGKLHAVLARPHAKGRDFYDLLWYLAAPDWPDPNLVFLNNALSRTAWTGEPVTAGSWAPLVAGRVSALDWRLVRRDVEPFIAESSSRAAFTQAALLELLARR